MSVGYAVQPCKFPYFNASRIDGQMPLTVIAVETSSLLLKHDSANASAIEVEERQEKYFAEGTEHRKNNFERFVPLKLWQFNVQHLCWLNEFSIVEDRTVPHNTITRAVESTSRQTKTGQLAVTGFYSAANPMIPQWAPEYLR